MPTRLGINATALGRAKRQVILSKLAIVRKSIENVFFPCPGAIKALGARIIWSKTSVATISVMLIKMIQTSRLIRTARADGILAAAKIPKR